MLNFTEFFRNSKMENVLETNEKVLLERELNELMESTFKMEHELELLFQETGSR